jgi:hypothetical protein
MALLILLFITLQFFLSVGDAVDEAHRSVALFVVVVAVLLSWRRLGARLQEWVTTRQPSNAQLRSAIEVAESLLDDVRARPGAGVPLPRRIWNSGFPQVLAGFIATAIAVKYLAELWDVIGG